MEYWQLKQRQSLSLDAKLILTRQRIHDWYEAWNGQVYVSYSGGKDSTALLDIVRGLYPDVPAVFVDTGLEYPEIRKQVMGADNVTWLKPAMPFTEVIAKYGYPVVSKRVSRFVHDLQTASDANKNVTNLRLTGMNRQGVFCPSMALPDKWRFLIDAPFKISDHCCDVMKKRPLQSYAKDTSRVPISAVMACESKMREKQYLKSGCNAMRGVKSMSMPMSFWLEQDVLEYLYTRKLCYAAVYGDIVKRDGQYITTGERRTGCMFCCFGVQFDAVPNRFQRMQDTHPKQWEFCMSKLGLREVLNYLHIPSEYEPQKQLRLF